MSTCVPVLWMHARLYIVDFLVFLVFFVFVVFSWFVVTLFLVAILCMRVGDGGRLAGNRHIDISRWMRGRWCMACYVDRWRGYSILTSFRKPQFVFCLIRI